MSYSAWTADRITMLETLWRAGRSASEIAKALGGVTRNAVIGKIHRLGLAGRMPPTAPRRKRTDPSRRAPLRVAGPAKPPPPPAAPVVRARPTVAAIEAIARVFDGAALTARICRWPVRDSKARSFGYCGAAVVGKGPYCPGHHQVAYPPRLQVKPGREGSEKRPKRGGGGGR